MTHTRIRSFLLVLFLVILTLSLTACYTITLKEKRIDGMGSSITVKLPENPQNSTSPSLSTRLRSAISRAAACTVK